MSKREKGVVKFEDGSWGFVCAGCGLKLRGIGTRDDARAAYRAHRLEECSKHDGHASDKLPDSSGEEETPEQEEQAQDEQAQEEQAQEEQAQDEQAQDEQAQEAPKPKTTRTFRIGVITNPRTGKPVTMTLRKDGTLVKYYRERYGITSVDEWREIEASSYAEANRKYKAGEGRKMTRGK